MKILRCLLCVVVWIGGTGLVARGETQPSSGVLPLPDETVFIPELRGVITVPSENAVNATVPAGFAGVDTSRTPLLNDPHVAELLGQFVGRPMSFGSMDRLCVALRVWLNVQGQSLVSVYVPPQEITEGVLRVVVRRARLEGELMIEGARWFSPASYRAALSLRSGDELDAVALQAAVARLNRHSHRQVVLAAEPGSTPGSTRLVMRAQERRPWQITTGFSNTGTAVTDEERVFIGFSWANAFGRGDSLGYSFSADPALDHSRAHSANYGTVFASGHALSAFGSYATIESVLPAPLTQNGKTWQLGSRFAFAPAKTTDGWERTFSVGADFKYSDNTLEFATIPITDNVTHVAQLAAMLAFSKQEAARSLGASVSVFVSPGGLTNRNDDAAFAASRVGATADYAYGRLDAYFAQRFSSGVMFNASLALQLASGPLLGTEQLGGGGSAGVRGYRESSAFGDEGALLNLELHAPDFSPFKAKDRATFFVFADGAILGTRGPGGGTTELASVGAGLSYRWSRHFSLRASYGWQLKRLPFVTAGDSHGHLSAQLSF